MTLTLDTAAGWHCLKCGDEFPTPSFSEGPKVWDEERQAIVRFTQALNLCPNCLSWRIGRIYQVRRLNS